MFKKGQLVRVTNSSALLWVITECHYPFNYDIRSTTKSRFNYIDGRFLTLIGNNYKEKPRDAIQERRDSYK